MIRGGHIDITILGAFEVAANGDLANWDMRVPNKGPLVGGAMDLAAAPGRCGSSWSTPRARAGRAWSRPARCRSRRCAA